MPERFEIRVPGRVRHLGTVRGFFGVLARENPALPLTEAEIGEIQLVIQEACINVIRHAQQDDFGLLEVAFVIEGDRLVIEVRDQGPGFDPGAVPDPDAENLQEGGYGVYIMKQSMDSIETTRDGRGFLLRLTRLFPIAARAESREG